MSKNASIDHEDGPKRNNVIDRWDYPIDRSRISSVPRNFLGIFRGNSEELVFGQAFPSQPHPISAQTTPSVLSLHPGQLQLAFPDQPARDPIGSSLLAFPIRRVPFQLVPARVQARVRSSSSRFSWWSGSTIFKT
ncbi:hypothetical protein YC2023_115498 [Brassica napus]